MDSSMDRRGFVTGLGVAGLAGVAALALPACAGNGGAKGAVSDGKGDGASPAEEALAALPVPSPDKESPFGVDENINVGTIDSWLGREDVAYFDVRMFVDPASYGDIGGDPNLSATVEGFKVVPYPFLGTLQKLPVEGAYTGDTLYEVVWGENGEVVSATPQFAEADLVMSDLFPKDKAIFLMCGGGGYAGMAKTLLIHLGWDVEKLYNIGGFWEYEGDHVLDLVTYPSTATGAPAFATWRADYAYLDFNTMHRV